jgi:hypothetical protein
MITKKLTKSYLKTLVDRVFKILPMYEEKNETLFTYIQSLLYELGGFQELVDGIEKQSDFVSLLATLEALSTDSVFFDAEASHMKRETFKCINLIKRIEEKTTVESGA